MTQPHLKRETKKLKHEPLPKTKTVAIEKHGE